jgi:hypothetical protein
MKHNPEKKHRFSPPESMIISSDERSVRRGRRNAPRTEVCRPCLYWLESAPNKQFQGVLLDLTPYGMRLRSLAPLEKGAVLFVQLMRDESFEVALSAPIQAHIVYAAPQTGGFYDLGLKRDLKIIPKPRDFVPMNGPISRRPVAKATKKISERMHSLNPVMERGARRMGKKRG